MIGTPYFIICCNKVPFVVIFQISILRIVYFLILTDCIEEAREGQR